jgi:carboxyl-terminal processing protease
MRSVVGLVFLAACGGAAQPQPSARPVQPPGGQPAPPSGAQAKPVPTPAPVEPEPADPRVAADLKSFDMVWQRVAESFYDPAYGGVDWKGVRAELRPKILETKTREEARELMNKALERLGKSHFGVSGPLDEEGEGGSAEDAGVGIEIRIIDKAAIVTRVERGSAAEQAKVKLGAELVTVEKIEVAPRIAELARKLPPSSLVPMRQARSVAKLLAGKPGTKVAVGVKTGGKVAALTLERAHVGRPASLGNLGTHRVVYEGQKLEPQIGYIRLSMFLDPPAIVPAFAKDLAAWKDAAGVVIDLRGNPGGIGGMAMGMAGHLIAEQNKKLGTMRTRQSSLDFVVNPQAQRYAGKVAVLIDEMSASTSEIFAGGLQDLGRARIFGRRSPGAALPSVIEALPNGDRFQYAIADYVSAGGKTLEGNGVTPDVPVALDLPALRGGKDPDLAAAIRWIKEKP